MIYEDEDMEICFGNVTEVRKIPLTEGRVVSKLEPVNSISGGTINATTDTNDADLYDSEPDESWIDADATDKYGYCLDCGSEDPLDCACGND
jgi:hypothetical protein